MSRARADEIIAAAVAAIRADQTLDYIPDSQVHTLPSDAGMERLVLKPPCIIVSYLGGPYRAATVTLKHYTVAERLVLLAVARNLRLDPSAALKGSGSSVERSCLEILEDLKALFAGARLALANGAFCWCRLEEITYEGLNKDGLLTYGLGITCRGNWDQAG